MEDIAEFLKDREEALLSLDLAKVNAYRAKYGDGPMPDDETTWVAIHKARTAITTFPEDAKQASREWLSARGYKAMA